MQCWKKLHEGRARGCTAGAPAARLGVRRGIGVARPRWRPSRRGLGIVALTTALVSLAACGVIAQQSPGVLVVRSAQLRATERGATLDVGIDCHLSGPMQDALDHGIPLTLRVVVRAGHWPVSRAVATRHVELRYFPLSRRYQLREVGVDDVRSFATPSYLIAALESLRISLPPAFAALPAATSLRVSVALDPVTLPGALRLPALFEPAWRFAAADYTWRMP